MADAPTIGSMPRRSRSRSSRRERSAARHAPTARPSASIVTASPCTTPVSGKRSKSATWRATRSGSELPSSSARAISVPRARATIVACTAPGRGLGSWRTTRTRASSRPATSSAVPSIAPSSTTSTSRSSYVCARQLAIASCRVAALPRVAIASVTRGCGAFTRAASAARSPRLRRVGVSSSSGTGQAAVRSVARPRSSRRARLPYAAGGRRRL